jgi:uncharacterized protein YjbJ (UPF0337 family)
MTINEDTIKGKWKEIKGDIQKTWGRLTDDELEQTKGDLKAVGGLIQQRYGEVHNTYSKKLNQIFGHFDQDKEAAVSGLKDSLKTKPEVHSSKRS